MADSAARSLSSLETYALWSQVYDEEPNPMLSLEERVLTALLPRIEGKDVIDLGCGTGRWLAALSHKSPASLGGIDISAEMLERAAIKLGLGTPPLPAVRRCGAELKLFQGDCSSAVFPGQSADLILSSFLLSHLPDPYPFAAQLARLLRPGGSAFISDLHPRTVRALHWSRSFRHTAGLVHLGTEDWELEFLKTLFKDAGLEVTTEIEARFGPPEIQLLRRAGRTSLSEAALSHPAIYILQLCRVRKFPCPTSAAVSRCGQDELSSATSSVPHVCRSRHTWINLTPTTTTRVRALANAHIALTATDSVLASLGLDHTRISAITAASSATADAIDLTGYTLLPGLINAHDHLEFSLFPRLGHGPYENCADWYSDIHSRDAATIARYKRVPKSTRVWFGALRNLLCGVTTVCHHNPLTGDMLSEDFPIRVVRDFGWAHSILLEKNFAARHHRTAPDRPFIIHLAEGLDSRARRDLDDLVAAGILDHRTAIVHGLAFDHDAIRTLNHHDAALIWCPSSNDFLFGRTHLPAAIASFRNVALGSDSPLTAAGDFLDELRLAATEVGIPANDLYAQATSNSARILRLAEGFGQIRSGAVADLIAVPASSSSPAEILSHLSYRDIHLVLRGGRVQLASNEMLARIPKHLSRGLRPLEIDGLVRWVRAPLSRLFADATRALGCDIFMNGRRLRNVTTAWF
jgi:cytosine/adenosine deaminase-related metal-dependent hydrolase/ubiquinone/menaquinone biosynthesis C-methylase UbiE